MGPSFIPQPNGGALLSGGKTDTLGPNQRSVRQRAQAVRGQLIGRSEHSSRRVAAGRPSLIPQADEPDSTTASGARSEVLGYGPCCCFRRSLAGALPMAGALPN